MAVKVFCPNCGSEVMVGDGAFAQPVTTEQNGNAYLVLKEVHNDNITKDAKAEVRMAALKAAGVDVNKLQTLMQSNDSLKDIFSSDDPIINELSKGGFIRNPELFRRFICAQTFRLLKDKNGWTHAVRSTYDTRYVLDMTKRELNLLVKLRSKCPNDIRFNFFTLDDLKEIFCDLMRVNDHVWKSELKDEWMRRFVGCRTYSQLADQVNAVGWRFSYRTRYMPKAWLNCFKGAGAYYTLQNIIRTHGLVIPGCKDMNDSLEAVENTFKDIIGYEPRDRRWDILMSVLVMSVNKTNFELKY